jgi:hypothetical protein
MQEFEHHVYRQTGTCVFILSASMDADDQVMVSW